MLEVSDIAGREDGAVHGSDGSNLGVKLRDRSAPLPMIGGNL